MENIKVIVSTELSGQNQPLRPLAYEFEFPTEGHARLFQESIEEIIRQVSKIVQTQVVSSSWTKGKR